MKEIKFKNNVFGLKQEYIIKNKIHGVEIEPKDKYCKPRDIVDKFLISLIDMDGWNHSWHMDISEHHRKKEVKSKVKELLEKKIESRKREIEEIEFGLKLLSRKM